MLSLIIRQTDWFASESLILLLLGNSTSPIILFFILFLVVIIVGIAWLIVDIHLQEYKGELQICDAICHFPEAVYRRIICVVGVSSRRYFMLHISLQGW